MGSGTVTQGIVLCDRTRTVDARARSYKRIERAPAAVVNEALESVRAILGDCCFNRRVRGQRCNSNRLKVVPQQRRM